MSQYVYMKFVVEKTLDNPVVVVVVVFLVKSGKYVTSSKVSQETGSDPS